MRNRYPGTCYWCGKRVEIGEGHFERHNGRWRVIHAECVFEQRRVKARKKQAMAREQREESV